MNPPGFRRAFTLVELLVVVAIISCLAAFLLPALSRARAQARSVQCAANLQQWGLAFRQYADDNQDFLPRRGQGVKPLQQIDRPEDWFNALPRYLGLPAFQQTIAGGERIAAGAASPFICPVAADPGATYFLPYAMNMNLCPWGDSGTTDPVKFSDVVRPVNVVAMADGPGPYCAVYPSANAYSPMSRHAGRVNILFLAGGVRTFAGDYVGCGAGDPGRPDVSWLTGTASDAGAGKY